MKIFKLFIVIVLTFLCTSCSSYGEKRLVKLVTADSDFVCVYYYDYSSEKPAYLAEQKANTGVQNTLTQILSENDYDLKLCRYAVCSEDIIATDIENIFYALTDSRFSPDIAIVQGNTKNWQNYIELDTSPYPIYSFKVDTNGITGVIEDAESNGRNMIIQNTSYKKLENRQAVAADIAGKLTDKAVYVFEYEGTVLSAQLENIMVYYTFDTETVQMNVNTTLKSYKGMSADTKVRKQFISLLQQALEDDILTLHNDYKTAQCLNLNWYRQLNDTNAFSVKVNIC